MANERKKIQTARMWRYFLDAASELMEEKGLNNIKIREIADRAGYTSSTAYNYFRDLSHLKFLRRCVIPLHMYTICPITWKKAIIPLKNGCTCGNVFAVILLNFQRFTIFCTLKISV